MSGLEQYLGRTFDVMAFQGVTTRREAKLSQELFDTEAAGRICTGIQKLVQRFLLELLTRRGSMTFLPDRGCDFLTQAARGFRTEMDVSVEFALAIVDISRNLQAEETDEWPDDERFADAELTGILLSSSQLSLSIRLTSRAGTSRTFIAPVAALPMAIGV